MVLVVGSTMRLTRLATTDDLGLWLIRDPAARWAQAHPEGWRDKAVGGLECPFCVGFWIGLVVLLLPRRNRLVRWVLAGLALNELTAHLGARLGDVADDPEEQ